MRIKTEAKQIVVLQAARHEFITTGSYANVSMDSIARTADVSKQTLYSYFATKEALFMAVVADVIGQPWNDEFPQTGYLQATTTDAYAAALVRLLKLVRSKLMHTEYLAILRIIIAESQSQPQLAAVYKRQVVDRAFGGVCAILEDARRKQVLAIDPVLGTRMLIGSMMTYVLIQGLLSPSKIQPPTDDDVQAIVSNLMMINNKEVV